MVSSSRFFPLRSMVRIRWGNFDIFDSFWLLCDRSGIDPAGFLHFGRVPTRPRSGTVTARAQARGGEEQETNSSDF